MCDGFELVGVTDIFEDKDDEDKQDEKKGILSMLANLQPDIALLGPFKPGRAWEAEILAYTKDRIRVILSRGMPNQRYMTRSRLARSDT